MAKDQRIKGKEVNPELTKENVERALCILKDPLLLYRFLKITDEMGFIGEEINRILMYLICTSRLSDHPNSIIVKGNSSGGKSHLINTVVSYFPPEDLEIKTAISTQALYNRTKDLIGKILVIQESTGAENCDYAIRSLQSEGRLEYDK
jgi:DNA primase